MSERGENKPTNEPRGALIRIFGTNLSNPEKGRIFLWTKAGWFERIESQSGDLTFASIAQSEHELRLRVALDDPSIELVQLSPEYRNKVSGEFLGQFLTNDLELYLAKEREKKNRLLTITGISLVVIGLLLFGISIYFRVTYSPNNFPATDYKSIFRQVYSAGLSGILVGGIMDIFGWIIMGLASASKDKLK